MRVYWAVVTGLSVSVCVRVSFLSVAVKVDTWRLTTLLVVMPNVSVAAPSGMITFAGRVIAASGVERNTVRPPTGATSESVTVPVVLRPPVKTLLRRVNVVNPPGRTSSWMPCVFEPQLAVRITRSRGLSVVLETMGNVTVLLPAGTVTISGTSMLENVDASATGVPPAGAAVGNTMLPVALVIPPT